MARFRPEALPGLFGATAFAAGLVILLSQTLHRHPDPVLIPAGVTLVLTPLGSLADRGRRDRLDRLEAELRRRQQNGRTGPGSSPTRTRKPR